MECKHGGRVAPVENQACRGRTGPTCHSPGAAGTSTARGGGPNTSLSMGACRGPAPSVPRPNRPPGAPVEEIPLQFRIPRSAQNWRLREEEPSRSQQRRRQRRTGTRAGRGRYASSPPPVGRPVRITLEFESSRFPTIDDVIRRFHNLHPRD